MALGLSLRPTCLLLFLREGARRPATNGLAMRTFSPETEPDVISVVNAYTAGWPYCQPLGPELIAHWRTLGPAFQPDRMRIASRDGEPRAFAHGELDGDCHYVHLLAMVPGAIEEGVELLRAAEQQARAAGATRLCGPTCVSGKFYGGYVLGLEPYHPHWGTAATEAFVQVGFRITQSEALMIASRAPVSEVQIPRGYELVETPCAPEFEAVAFRYAALYDGREVAVCGGRLYPSLPAPSGGTIGQVGPVDTDEAHRNRGLATALVTLTLDRLWHWGAVEALVSTGLENGPALRAYEKAGFRRRHNLNEWSKEL